jgi:hypothetical protein
LADLTALMGESPSAFRLLLALAAERTKTATADGCLQSSGRRIAHVEANGLGQSCSQIYGCTRLTGWTILAWS